MQTGPDLSGEPVLNVPAPTVRVSGTTRGVVSWAVDREIPGDLPAQVVSGSGITAAGADVQWAPPATVSSRAVSAFARSGGWPPKGGERVTLDAGYDGNLVRLFTGALEDVDGGSGGVTTSRFVDRVPALERDITIIERVALMPAFNPGEPVRLVGHRHESIVNKCFRASGFWATPAPSGDIVLDAPLMGSLLNEDSSVYVSSATPWDQALEYRTSKAPGSRWGLSMSDFRVTYTIVTKARRSLGSGVFLTSFMVDPASTDYVTVTDTFEGGTIVVQQMPSNIAVTVNGAQAINHPVSAGAYDRVAVILNGHTVTMRTGMSTTTGGNIVAEASTVVSTIPTGVLTQVRITAMPNAAVAGVQVGWPNFADMWRPITFQRTAVFQVGYLFQSLGAFGGTQATNAMDLVIDIAKALCAGFWVDEYGVAQWRHPDMLRTGPVVKTITAATSLVNLDWRDSLASARSAVVVAGEEPHIAYNPGIAVATAWEGSGETIAPGQSTEYIITPPADETWIYIEEPMVLDSTNIKAYQRRRGSWVGAVSVNADGDENWLGYEVAKSWERIAVQTWKLTVVNQLATMDINQRTPDQMGFHPIHRGRGLPVIRCQEKITWVEETVRAEAHADKELPEYTHDVGRWVQMGDRARLAGWLAGQLSAPIPEITNLQIIPDPRLQLGDRVTVVDPDVTDLNVTGVIVGISISGAAGELSMSLTIRVVSTSAGLVRYLDVQARNADRSYSQNQTAWANTPYATHEADPLAK